MPHYITYVIPNTLSGRHRVSPSPCSLRPGGPRCGLHCLASVLSGTLLVLPSLTSCQDFVGAYAPALAPSSGITATTSTSRCGGSCEPWTRLRSPRCASALQEGVTRGPPTRALWNGKRHPICQGPFSLIFFSTTRYFPTFSYPPMIYLT